MGRHSTPKTTRLLAFATIAAMASAALSDPDCDERLEWGYTSVGIGTTPPRPADRRPVYTAPVRRPPLAELAADLDADGYLTMGDVGLLLALFRSSPDPQFLQDYDRWVRGDINFDRVIDEQDLHLLLHLVTEDMRPKGCVLQNNCCAIPYEEGGCCGIEGYCRLADMKSYRPPYRRPLWSPIPDPIDLEIVPIVGSGVNPAPPPSAPDEATSELLHALRGLPTETTYLRCYPPDVQRTTESLRLLDEPHARWLLTSEEPALISAGLYLANHLHRPDIIADFAHHLDDRREGAPDLACDMRANVIIGTPRYNTSPKTIAERARASVKRWFGIDPESSAEFRRFLPKDEHSLDRLDTWTSLMTAAARSHDADRRTALRNQILTLPEDFRWILIASEQKERDRSSRDDRLVFTSEQAAVAMDALSAELRRAILEHRAPVPADVMRRARFTPDPSAELRTHYEAARRATGSARK